MDKLKIQRATVDDHLAIQRLAKKAFRGFFLELEDKKWILNQIKNHFYYIIKNNNRLIGMMCLEDDGTGVINIETLAISKSYQKKGLGKLLISKAISVVKKMNSLRTKTPRIEIITVASDDRYKAKDFYLKMGFKITHEFVLSKKLYRYFEMKI
jgi:N-acetylglutamate synthase-like GNAT family acetyltransferase